MTYRKESTIVLLSHVGTEKVLAFVAIHTPD